MPYVHIPGIRRPRVTAAQLEQLRRDLAMARPRRPQNLTRRIDYYANTSLDMSGPPLPQLPRRRRQPHDMQAEQQAIQNIQIMEEAHAEEVEEEHAADSADRKADRLVNWQSGTEDFKRVFETAVDNWVRTHSPAAQAFQKHLVNAAISAEKDVRIYDVASWFPNLPHDVALPLRDLCKRLHGAAKLHHSLLEKKDEAGGMLFDDQFHPELAFGMCCTKLTIQPLESGGEVITVGQYPNFGTDETHMEFVGRFDNFDNPHPQAKPLTLRLALYRIQAQLETRKVLLQQGARNQFDTTSMSTLRIAYLNPVVTKADLQPAFAAHGNVVNIYIEPPAGTGILESSTAFVRFEHPEEAAKAHLARRNTLFQGNMIKISRVTPDLDRITTWDESVDKAMCEWSLAALDYLVGKLNAFNQKKVADVEEGRLIAQVHNEVKGFCKIHNFPQIAMAEGIEGEYDETVVMDSDPASTPALRASLDALDDQLEVFEEEFGDGIVGPDWRMSYRGRRQ
ncbi:hypothetical protein CLAFUW4_10671 [Fulvia fulva]|uniref:RRM domain-containing protein n=1 Tax=Passalora fulva TaxID=5499 RepID=A0A9Q8P7W8_PASFU|nr:uncharacterized protein CLAFUR5_05284 [Fulvia fulva]KAK4615631.1 hypothetical protein CLAFUR4_10676 [Fulvia fulva]KAK4616570.1 hypothetical protein CLAFUR0_10567 [Fulvia fulva]UJO16590.1 hypothetical protein CLAFUR5_05284 [Fulvia fulva]WPV18834.1 hypothetical protein CLAFUW4_10671 [Fulvia fulva]WPV34428.1 hypothetical protein CLAFUW7_10673 [Fulvia fulva]